MPLFAKLDRNPSERYDNVRDSNEINEKPQVQYDQPAPAYPGTVEAPTNDMSQYPNGNLDTTTHGARSVYTPQTDPQTQPMPPHNYGHTTQPDPTLSQNHHKDHYAPTGGANPFNDPYHDEPSRDANNLNQQYIPRPFQQSIPIESLQTSPASIHCPYCNRTAVTRPRRKTGNITHAIALVVCATVCLGCIPYFVSGIKDVDHYCGNCNRRVAKWHRSGWVEPC